MSIAGERWLLDMLENYGAALSCVDSVVAADVSTWAGNFGTASLANQHLALVDFLPAETLDTIAPTSTFVGIIARTASFNV